MPDCPWAKSNPQQRTEACDASLGSDVICLGLNVAIVYAHSNGICAPIKWLPCAAILLVDTHTCTFHNMKINCIL